MQRQRAAGRRASWSASCAVERVYVSPRQIAQAAELDQAAVNRALQGAVEAASVRLRAAVPRPGGPHARARTSRSTSWASTSTSKQRRKDAEYAKLDRMIALRHEPPLPAAGDPRLLRRSQPQQACGTCDNCQCRRRVRRRQRRTASDATAAQQRRPAPSPPANRRSRRSGPDRPLRRGPHEGPLRQADAGQDARRLQGQGDRQVQPRPAQHVWPAQRHLKEPQAIALIDALLAARLLQQVEETPHRPLVRLTPRGEEVMKGAAALTERLQLGRATARADLRIRLQAAACQASRRKTDSRRKSPAARRASIRSTTPTAELAADGDELDADAAADRTAARATTSAAALLDVATSSPPASPPTSASRFAASTATRCSSTCCRPARDGQPIEPPGCSRAEQLATLDDG